MLDSRPVIMETCLRRTRRSTLRGEWRNSIWCFHGIQNDLTEGLSDQKSFIGLTNSYRTYWLMEVTNRVIIRKRVCLSNLELDTLHVSLVPEKYTGTLLSRLFA